MCVVSVVGGSLNLSTTTAPTQNDLNTGTIQGTIGSLPPATGKNQKKENFVLLTPSRGGVETNLNDPSLNPIPLSVTPISVSAKCAIPSPHQPYSHQSLTTLISPHGPRQLHLSNSLSSSPNKWSKQNSLTFFVSHSHSNLSDVDSLATSSHLTFFANPPLLDKILSSTNHALKTDTVENSLSPWSSTVAPRTSLASTTQPRRTSVRHTHSAADLGITQPHLASSPDDGTSLNTPHTQSLEDKTLGATSKRVGKPPGGRTGTEVTMRTVIRLLWKEICVDDQLVHEVRGSAVFTYRTTLINWLSWLIGSVGIEASEVEEALSEVGGLRCEVVNREGEVMVMERVRRKEAVKVFVQRLCRLTTFRLQCLFMDAKRFTQLMEVLIPTPPTSSPQHAAPQPSSSSTPSNSLTVEFTSAPKKLQSFSSPSLTTSLTSKNIAVATSPDVAYVPCAPDTHSSKRDKTKEVAPTDIASSASSSSSTSLNFPPSQPSSPHALPAPRMPTPSIQTLTIESALWAITSITSLLDVIRQNFTSNESLGPTISSSSGQGPNRYKGREDQFTSNQVPVPPTPTIVEIESLMQDHAKEVLFAFLPCPSAIPNPAFPQLIPIPIRASDSTQSIPGGAEAINVRRNPTFVSGQDSCNDAHNQDQSSLEDNDDVWSNEGSISETPSTAMLSNMNPIPPEAIPTDLSLTTLLQSSHSPEAPHSLYSSDLPVSPHVLSNTKSNTSSSYKTSLRPHLRTSYPSPLNESGKGTKPSRRIAPQALDGDPLSGIKNSTSTPLMSTHAGGVAYTHVVSHFIKITIRWTKSEQLPPVLSQVLSRLSLWGSEGCLIGRALTVDLFECVYQLFSPIELNASVQAIRSFSPSVLNALSLASVVMTVSDSSSMDTPGSSLFAGLHHSDTGRDTGQEANRKSFSPRHSKGQHASGGQTGRGGQRGDRSPVSGMWVSMYRSMKKREQYLVSRVVGLTSLFTVVGKLVFLFWGCFEYVIRGEGSGRCFENKGTGTRMGTAPHKEAKSMAQKHSKWIRAFVKVTRNLCKALEADSRHIQFIRHHHAALVDALSRDQQRRPNNEDVTPEERFVDYHLKRVSDTIPTILSTATLMEESERQWGSKSIPVQSYLVPRTHQHPSDRVHKRRFLGGAALNVPVDKCTHLNHDLYPQTGFWASDDAAYKRRRLTVTPTALVEEICHLQSDESAKTRSALRKLNSRSTRGEAYRKKEFQGKNLIPVSQGPHYLPVQHAYHATLTHQSESIHHGSYSVSVDSHNLTQSPPPDTRATSSETPSSTQSSVNHSTHERQTAHGKKAARSYFDSVGADSDDDMSWVTFDMCDTGILASDTDPESQSEEGDSEQGDEDHENFHDNEVQAPPLNASRDDATGGRPRPSQQRSTVRYSPHWRTFIECMYLANPTR
eukprot:GHVN01082833.1.p1 GENE.GHVN01082833.1~~GHVN01082833.1.p1  ORF type:complete len:1436 (+),score=327.72 GHVN01082833.1:90-4310(+)